MLYTPGTKADPGGRQVIGVSEHVWLILLDVGPRFTAENEYEHGGHSIPLSTHSSIDDLRIIDPVGNKDL